MCTTQPRPRSTIGPTTDFVSRKGPTRFTASALSTSSQSVSSSRRSGTGPSVLALWTSRSMSPTSAAAAPAMRWMAALSPTSSTMAWASSPPDRMRATDSSSGPRSRATSTTRAPRAASAAPRAAPSPRLPPVTIVPAPRSFMVVHLSPPSLRPESRTVGAGDNPLEERYSLGMDTELGARLGQNLKQLREARGATQAQMAKLADLPRATWANLESGASNPTLSVLDRVASALQVTLEELVATPRASAQRYPRGTLPVKQRGNATIYKLLPDAV